MKTRKNLMKYGSLLWVAIFAVLCASCLSSRENAGISPAVFDMAKNAVFEVVLEKPTKDSLIYDKELDWSRVPFVIRNDKYDSIGTAFAISKTEIITAFHVIEGKLHGKYFIRDKNGEVFEVDQVVSASNEKDFVILTVKNRTFDTYFEFNRNFREGQQVFSIGNALGEGIVIRNGLILGSIPEEDSGRWNLLKTSADGSPGNSGGPLVSSDGKVVALITARRDNIIYSLPASVILDNDRTKLDYRFKASYEHPILANKLNRTFEARLPLPQFYQDIRKQLIDEALEEYSVAMDILFMEAPVYLTGSHNRWLLNSVTSAESPEIDYVDSDDGEWKLSDFSIKSYSLADDGVLMYAYLGRKFYNWSSYKLNKPNSVSLVKSYEPRYIMDTILQSISLDRTLGDDEYRILSYGDPEEVSSYQDSLGRQWITAQWLIEFEDQVLIMYILPLPNGPSVITVKKASVAKNICEWSIRKICDHVQTAYSGTFDGWNEYLCTNYVPDFIKNLDYRWQEDAKQLSFSTGDIILSVNDSVFDWNGSSELFLSPSHYMLDGEIHFGIRRILLSQDSLYKEYINVNKRLKPDTRLPTNIQENWNDVFMGKFPYDERPAISAKDNKGSMGGVLTPFSEKTDLRYTLYLRMDNPQNEDNLSRRFNAFKDGVKIRAHSP